MVVASDPYKSKPQAIAVFLIWICSPCICVLAEAYSTRKKFFSTNVSINYNHW